MSHSRRERVQSIVAELQPLLSTFEERRQFAVAERAKGMNACWCAGGGALLLFLLIASLSQNPVIGLIVSGLAFLLAWFYINATYFAGRRAAYVSDYKQQVLSKLTQTVQPQMEYRPHQGISKEMFKSAGIHRSRIDRYKSEDLFCGKVGDTELWFSEVKAERKETSRDSKGNTKTRWVTVFDGVFLTADFHKHFSTWVTVMPDFAEKSFGWFGKKLQNLGGGVVRLENPEFEQAFVVRGGDQVEARYLLTPDMQLRMLDLRRQLGESLKFSFRDSSVVMTFNCRDNLFEPDFFRPSSDSSQLERFVMEMESCCSVVEALNLNTRIWTKQ